MPLTPEAAGRARRPWYATSKEHHGNTNRSTHTGDGRCALRPRARRLADRPHDGRLRRDLGNPPALAADLPPPAGAGLLVGRAGTAAPPRNGPRDLRARRCPAAVV